MRGFFLPNMVMQEGPDSPSWFKQQTKQPMYEATFFRLGQQAA